jgi:hypothetical protein
MSEKPPVKSYCGGVPNYCTPEVPCKTHPDAPHGFDRNASHSADRYVCECEGWEPPEQKTLYMDMSQVPTGMPDWKPGMVFPAPKREWVGLTDEEIDTLANEHLVDVKEYIGAGEYICSIDGEVEFARAIEAKIKEKNGE